MEPSKEAIAVRITRLNRQILGKVTSGSNKLNKKTIDREALLDALTVLYDECNDDPVKKTDELVRAFVDKYRSTLAELRRTRVCLSDFEILQTIGRGHFGEVHMVREKDTGDVYALKTLRKEQARKRAAGAAEDERDVLANNTGPWMPKLQYAFQDTNNLYLVMELCSGGDLAGLLARRNHPLAESDAAFYVAEVAHALKALHGMGYVHRDIKPHNIFLDRCGHVKVGDFGSCARLSEGGATAVGTPDYVAPELLAAADCAARHSVCLPYCRSAVTTAISACDYWSLGVVAFELVTLRRPFSTGDEDSIAEILANIQKYERDPSSEPPFEPPPSGPSAEWRGLVAGLLRVAPARRYNYLDTLQHAALQRACKHLHSIRDQAPPWVPTVRGVEDASHFSPPPRDAPQVCSTPFRTRPPFAGQLPFIGYSYVAQEESEDSTGGFNASHDCTAIDLATFKSAEKLAAMRGREISSLQTKLAAAEAAAGAAAERTRRDADAEAERTRARLQAEITALSLQNRRLERQVEVEKEERMALQRTNQELSTGISTRAATELRAAEAQAAALQAERDGLQADLRRLEQRVSDLQAECARAVAAADSARAQHQHYKDIIEHVHELRHRRLTEINVRAVDSLSKERALRRQTLSGSENESRELATRLAAAEAALARETRARTAAERRHADLEDETGALRADHAAVTAELEAVRSELAAAKESVNEKQRAVDLATQQMKESQQQLAQERVKNSSLAAQVQELQAWQEEAARREAALEQQGARTEARLTERLDAADARAAAALADEARHREKVSTLEQLVRQLEREVGALESRACVGCATRAQAEAEAPRDTASDTESLADAAHAQLSLLKDQLERAENQLQISTQRQLVRQLEREVGALESRACVGCATRAQAEAEAPRDTASDTESLADAAHAQLSLLKDQLERAENQLQARAEEIAALRQEARSANLARWRKEREYNDLSVEAKSSARDIKRLEDRLSHAVEARKTAEAKAAALDAELATLRPQHEHASKDAERLREQLERLRKAHETAQAEVDRSRNDIRKLKSELQYSEKRRMHAEEQEELSSRERMELREELQQLRAQNNDLVQNNKALQEACGLLEEQLTDLEKLADIHEIKNKDLENETSRLRGELSACRQRLAEAERQASERGAAAGAAQRDHDDARDAARHAHCQLQLLRERLENREARVAELESRVSTLEGAASGSEAALHAALRRVRDLQEETSALRTRAHDHHAAALQLQAALADAQEELAGAREAAEAAAAWWRTRETKADATLRQQAKLIDFLQAKVEEAGRKKCSLSNKLFGRSGRRSATSPPLRRANRELREEVERLRAQLASRNGETDYPPTPRREKSKPPVVNGRKSIDTPDGPQDNNTVQIVWSDGVRERMRLRWAEGALALCRGDASLRATLLAPDARDLPQNEANRAFAIKVESPSRCDRAAVVCGSIEERRTWVSRLAQPPPAAGYAPQPLCLLDSEPTTALHVAPNVVAIGCSDGLHSLRGPIRLALESEEYPLNLAGQPVLSIAAVAGRALLVCGGALLHTGLLALGSALRRSSNLRPVVSVDRVSLPDTTPPHLVKAISGSGSESVSWCAAVACGRRVHVLGWDAPAAAFRALRSLTVDAAPAALLLTRTALLVAAARPLRLPLPAGALEPFAADEPVVQAAARKHSPPKAILLIKENPTEILVCYAECGVFVDEAGRRTRSEDARWSAAVRAWRHVHPFLYAAGERRVSVLHVGEDAYRAPPCTCAPDAASLASASSSDCARPAVFDVQLAEPALLGAAPAGVLVRFRDEDGFRVALVDGLAAFRSVGASVESLETLADSRGSSTDLARSVTDLAPPDPAPPAPQDVSQESVEASTGFLADIRKRARQLRAKNRKERTPDDVIKEILTTEVGLKRPSAGGRRSPATISEFDSDSSESAGDERTESTRGTSDVCAEMFARQVRFQ